MLYIGDGLYSDSFMYLQHHGVKGMKWGVRNGPPYPVNSDRLSRNIFNEAKKREPSITKDVLDSAANANSNMYGLEHKLKTIDSIKRKIDTDSEEKSISISNAAKDIKDAVRYTTISDDDVFVLNYKTFKSKMEDKGYKEVRCKNYFDLYNQGKVKHKSVQSIFETPDGYKFEVQFQTPSSQKAKNKKVKIYEERRKQNISKEKQIELENKMVKLAERVKDPKDISDILTHSELYLCHHGIKGQKWGVKHGPPYPLNSKTNRMIRRSRNNMDYASRYQDYHDTSKTSKLIREQNDYKEEFSKLKKLSRKEPLNKSLNAVNPDVHGEGRNFNCQNSATAFEMRRRGYDVEARRRDDGSNISNMEKWFKDGEFTTVNDVKNSKDPFYKNLKVNDSYRKLSNRSPEYIKFSKEYANRQKEAYSDFCKELMKQPVGARGIWFVGWQNYICDSNGKNVKIDPSGGNFFHAMNYEITKDGPIFYDSQSKRHKIMKSTEWSTESTDPREYSYMRTDNLAMDPSVVEAVISRRN